MMSEVCQGMGVLDGVGDRRRERVSLEGNVGHITSEDFVRGGDAALPKLLWDFLLICLSL